MYSQTYPKKRKFLENFTQLASQKLTTLDGLLYIKTTKVSFLEFVETINRLTETQIKTIINQLQGFLQSEKILLELFSQIDAILDADLETYINNFLMDYLTDINQTFKTIN